MLTLIMICTFGTMFLLLLGLTMRSEREMLQDRMHRRAETGQAPGLTEMELEKPLHERMILPALRKLSDVGLRFTPSGALQAVDDRLETAGRPWNLGSREFIGLKVLSIGAFSIAGIALAKALDISPLVRLAFLILLVFIGVILPDYLVQRAINARQTRIRKVLADTLDLLTVSVEAGLGLDGAMQKVVEKLDNPLSQELARALHEMQVGKMRAEALRDMARRVKLAELTSFVAAICQADQLGVSISKVLRVQGDTLRTRRSQRARETAAKLPVKMLVPLVFFIFPAIFVVIAGPAAIGIARAFSRF